MKKSTETIMNNLMSFFGNVAASGLVAFILDKKILGFALLYGGIVGFLIVTLVLVLLDRRP